MQRIHLTHADLHVARHLARNRPVAAQSLSPDASRPRIRRSASVCACARACACACARARACASAARRLPCPAASALQLSSCLAVQLSSCQAATIGTIGTISPALNIFSSSVRITGHISMYGAICTVYFIPAIHGPPVQIRSTERRVPQYRVRSGFPSV
jgi:hypothetical protein